MVSRTPRVVAVALASTAHRRGRSTHSRRMCRRVYWGFRSASPRDHRRRMSRAISRSLRPSRSSIGSSELEPEELVRYSRHIGPRRSRRRRAAPTEAGERSDRRRGRARIARGAVPRGGRQSAGSASSDFDAVDLSNLQRQLLHDTIAGRRAEDRVGARRVCRRSIRTCMSRRSTRSSPQRTRSRSLATYDVVVDGTDNFKTRYLTNDACVLLGKPNVYGSVLRFEGQASVFATPDGPCYRCLFREPPPPGLVPSCAEAGVLGVLPGLIGTIQATEAIKLIVGVGDTLAGRLLLVDALRMHFRTIRLRRDPECPACGTRELKALIDYDEFCGTRSECASELASATGVREIDAARARGTAASRGRDRSHRCSRAVRMAYRSHRWCSTCSARSHLGAGWRIFHAIATSCCTVITASAAERRRSFSSRRAFSGVWNLSGGIDRWSAEVDPSVATY